MKERAGALWAWVNDHRRLSIILALLLIVVSVYVISLIPPPHGQECGTINYPQLGSGDAKMHAASLKMLSCFWQAYQHCQAATIESFYMGTDFGDAVTATVEQKIGGCDVYVERNIPKKFLLFRCASMTEQGENLHLSQCDNNQPSFDIQPITLSFRQ
jgi:hypothetical protein